MEQNFFSTILTVKQLIENIDSGELGLPKLQRQFIWKDTKVRDLFDSMMRGYPIGYLMLWECPTFDKKKTIGPGKHSYDSPSKVIIDGQQRLTSLYAVMKDKKVVNSDNVEKSIIISFNPIQNRFEVGYPATKKDPEWIYNISKLFTTRSQYEFIATFINQLNESRKEKQREPLNSYEATNIHEKIVNLQELCNQSVPVFQIKQNAEEEDVSEIFVRVNSGGVTLKQNDFILTLLSLHWDEGRKKIENFSQQSRLPPKRGSTFYNQVTEVSAQDIIRVVMAYAFGRARLKYGYKLLRGADFDKKGLIDVNLREDRFITLKTKLEDVLNLNHWHEFIKSIMGAGYLSHNIILSDNAIFYTYALFLIAQARFKVSYKDNKPLSSLWFFYASLTSLYTGSFESEVEKELSDIKELKDFDGYKKFIINEVESNLTNEYFTSLDQRGLAVSGKGNNAWNAYVASLIILDSKLLFSKGTLKLSKLFETGSNGNRQSLEKHHLFPKAHLKKQGYTDNEINQMANYAFIEWTDNQEILDEAPSEYYRNICKGMSDEQVEKMEDENALPHDWENMKYKDFLEKRRKLMAKKIKEAYEVLKGRVK